LDSAWSPVSNQSSKNKALAELTSDAYTINAVAQDEFEDVKVPDMPAQSPRAGASTVTNEPILK
jgi:hypothetical protein